VPTSLQPSTPDGRWKRCLPCACARRAFQPAAGPLRQRGPRQVLAMTKEHPDIRDGWISARRDLALRGLVGGRALGHCKGAARASAPPRKDRLELARLFLADGRRQQAIAEYEALLDELSGNHPLRGPAPPGGPCGSKRQTSRRPSGCSRRPQQLLCSVDFSRLLSSPRSRSGSKTCRAPRAALKGGGETRRSRPSRRRPPRSEGPCRTRWRHGDRGEGMEAGPSSSTRKRVPSPTGSTTSPGGSRPVDGGHPR